MVEPATRKQMELLTDEEIIKIFLEEEQPGLFNVIDRRYRKKVFDKCRNMVQDDVLAGDITQDIFSKVITKLDTFRKESSFSTWLYAITYHYCIEYLRRKKNSHYPSWSSQNEIPEIIDESEEDLIGIRYEKLLEVLEMIHPEEKALLLMKYQDDLPLRMIREVLRISESAVKMRLKRAKARVVYLYNLKFKEEE